MDQATSQPSQIDDIAERVRAAAAAGTTLCIRGGGSKDFLGQPPVGEKLETRGFSGIVAYEPSELVVTARAGTPLAELEALLASRNQCLPFEPPRFGAQGSVGGMVAAGLSGPARANAGAVRDYVLGLQLLNGKGELLTFGGQVMKNVAGYDVSRLMAGAFGTLGLMTEVSLKVLPLAPAEVTLRFECGQAEALSWLHAWGGRPLPLNASCWSAAGAGGLLELRLRGAQAAVEAACKTLGGERVDAAQADAGWQALRDQRAAWFTGRAADEELWRLSLPQTAAVLALEQPCLVEWHGGQRWLRVAAGQGDRLRALAAAAGGHATLFRVAGDGSSGAAPQRFDRPGAPLDRIHRELRRQFDPAGVFNPGRLYADA